MNTTRLILVRHGATEANLRAPYTLQGLRPDADLASEGVAQAQAAAEILGTFAIGFIYCSPLLRARRTAGLINEVLRAPLDIEPALVEVDIGRWAGLTWEEIERRWPKELRAFRDDPERRGYLRGENLADVRRRAVPAVERLIDRHTGETILVVGHGVVNRVLLAHWLGLPLRCARQLPQDNAGYSVVEFHGSEVRVRTINEAHHLFGAAA
jgi:broad specificity phosphatase PhoE